MKFVSNLPIIDSLFDLPSASCSYRIMEYQTSMNNGKNRSNIQIGASVGIVLKQDQKSGKITEGVVKKILTNSSSHPHGIKVQLEDGSVGRVKKIHSRE